MANAWQIAANIMKEYYAQNDLRWAPLEATDILRSAYFDNEMRWTDKGLVTRAENTLSSSVFDVDDLAENHLGIRITFDSLAYLDDAVGTKVLGCAYPSSKEILICERALEYEPLYRTTVLHEIAHVLLHRDPAKRCFMYTPDDQHPNREECEANQFMAVAILPKSVLKLAVAYLCHVWRINPRIPFANANTPHGRWIWKNRLFASLMNELCVSRQLISIKMQKMHYFSPETAAFHKTYALHTRWHEPIPKYNTIGHHVAAYLESLYCSLLNSPSMYTALD